MSAFSQLDITCTNNIRVLAADIVAKSNSG